MGISNLNLDKPNRTAEFEDLSRRAIEYHYEQQMILLETYEIMKYERWDYDGLTGILTFSNSENQDEILEVKYEVVGSISKITDTWLWSWANPHLDPIINTEIEFVKDWGEMNNLEPLTKEKWFGEEYDGWEMTRISSYLMKAKGSYCCPGDVSSFVIFKEINVVRKLSDANNI